MTAGLMGAGVTPVAAGEFPTGPKAESKKTPCMWAFRAPPSALSQYPRDKVLITEFGRLSSARLQSNTTMRVIIRVSNHYMGPGSYWSQ